MGIMLILLLAYMTLFLIDIVAFMHGMKTKKWIPCITITAIMILGIRIFWGLWVTSPM